MGAQPDALARDSEENPKLQNGDGNGLNVFWDDEVSALQIRPSLSHSLPSDQPARTQAKVDALVLPRYRTKIDEVLSDRFANLDSRDLMLNVGQLVESQNGF